jgi:hypothetical protein
MLLPAAVLFAAAMFIGIFILLPLKILADVSANNPFVGIILLVVVAFLGLSFIGPYVF